MTTEASIREIVLDELRTRFANRGLVNADVVFDEDFDGDKIVRVTVHFSEPREQAAESLFDAADAIRARLIEAGDDRFVFVRREYPGASDEIGSEEEAERTRTS
jgi:hypothetical protein